MSFRQILLETFGYQCLYHAVVDQSGQICALIPLASGRNLGLKRVGVSLPFVNYTDVCALNEEAAQFAMDAIVQLKEKYRLRYIELRFKNGMMLSEGKQLSPVLKQLDTAHRQVNDINHTFVLPLANEDEVLSLSTRNNRNHIRKVYKNNWFQVSYDKGNLARFHKVYVRRMKQLGSPAQDIRFFQRFLDYFPDHAVLQTVLDAETGEVAGGMLLLISPGDSTLYYPYGANLTAYNHKYLNNFMYWEAVKFGIRSGLKQLDLGRSQTGSGTYKYKEQWGAAAEQLTYVVMGSTNKEEGPPDKEKLRFFIELWKRMPNMVTEPVGKQLIKYLMP
ncbi:GNAT family N-acetyltransferase [Paenibacillus allorhizoplanae]|uniref:GNAT family N-acetyltransferase n=1 Tax=Paenibacillus allorhizoplanae TaxID=2905648 RepID=UPI001F489740|nr:GNAT family N-acetyltransferase [Paenibacillus allorhizoplanae]